MGTLRSCVSEDKIYEERVEPRLDIESILTIMLWRLLLPFALAANGVRAVEQEYIIYPIITVDKRAVSSIHSALVSMVSDPSKVYAFQYDPEIPPVFWTAPLSAPQAEELKRHPSIEDVHISEAIVGPMGSPDPPSMAARPIPPLMSYGTQIRPTATELRVISQPSGDPNVARYPNYVYEANRGRDSFIYHAEMGINENHLEFSGRRGEWVFTNQAFQKGQNTRNESPVGRGHSTCTASKASGNLYGASKHATLVVVKMPDYTEPSVIEVLFTAYQHIKTHGRQNRAVLVISWASFKIYRNGADFGTTERAIYRVLDSMSRIGVIILCAAGNYAQERTDEGLRTYVDTIPAGFDNASPFVGSLKVANLLAIGNCDLAGRRAYDSQTLSKNSYKSEQTFAPGVGIRCAAADSRDGSHSASGTSFCKL
ncbi:MAG: hypothetical protein Q9174_006492 [Haloplaca sp. 1 TL-2023]